MGITKLGKTLVAPPTSQLYMCLKRRGKKKRQLLENVWHMI